MASSDPNFLELPVEYRTNVTNIDQYYYPNVLQASEYTGQVHISGNGKYIVAHNMHVGTPYSEDTNSSGNDYQPGPWITLYKLENNTTSWIAGLENFGNNTFLTTQMPHIADHTIAMSHDGMKIIITRGGITSQYGIIDGQSNGNYGALVTLENTTQTSGITSSLSVSNITATNLNVTNDISCNNLLANGKIKFFQNNEQIASAADSNGVLTRLDNLDNNVITIPTTDSDGNALTANTTYEMTTGPAGSINNISFVKKQPEYVFCASKNGNQTVNQNESTLTGFRVYAQKNTGFSVNDAVLPSPNGEWTCPADGLYRIDFEVTFYSSADHLHRTTLYIFVNNTAVRAASTDVIGQSGDDFRELASNCSTIRDLSVNDTVNFRVVANSHGGQSTSVLHGIYTDVKIVRLG